MEHQYVMRGGSWDDSQWFARCAARYGDVPDTFYPDIGFRVVAPQPETSSLAEEAPRVMRGGSWYPIQRNARCAYRSRCVPDAFYPDLGFRVVVSLPDSDS